MRSVIAILLSIAFLLQSASKLLIMAHFEINKDYISKNICENRNKPKMHCNGKCHLKKQLQKEDKKNNSTSNNLKEKSSPQFFSEKTISLLIDRHTEINNWNTDYLLSNYSNSLLSVFHPPRA